jgi:hypothetical protein
MKSNIMRFFETMMFVCGCSCCLCQCVVFRTYDVPASNATFGEHQFKTWVIRAGTDSARYIRFDDIRKDDFTFSLGDLQRRSDHPKSKWYWRKFGRYKVDFFHITVADSIQLSPTMTLSYGDVQAASTHRVSFLTLPATVGLGFVYFALAFNLLLSL